MEVVNKKIKVVLILMLLILESISIFLMWKSINNKEIILDDVKLKDIKNNKNVAIMIETELVDGTTSYIESESSTWPIGMKLNINNSGCIDNLGNKLENALSYDMANNVVLIELDFTGYCYIYFDIIKDDITITVVTDGVLNSIPTGNKYKTELSCMKSNGIYNYKYHRIELSNINTNVICNLNYVKNLESYTLLKDEVESKATSGVDGYRYLGKEPNNWVWFNNELWRIIGSIPTCTDATIASGATSGTCNQTENTKPRLVKIIRASSIGSLEYHSADSNTTWGSGNTLYTLLNEYYYGKGNATGASPCLGYRASSYALCNYERIGISNSSTDYYGKMVKSVYMNVGTVSDESTKIDAVYDLEVATVSKLTKIGLINASDYGCAAISEMLYSGSSLSYLRNFTNSNWLYGQGNEWTLTPYSTSSVMYVAGYGGVSSSNYMYFGNAVRPSLYLDPSVYIISGLGTKENPYIIGM